FIESIDFFSDDIFTRNPKLLLDTLDVLKRKQPEIENVIGWKRYERIVRKFEEKTPAHNNH
ncbi:MAG: hypothetical protein K9J17_10865, partial [Flavobacteriales bacterium]|nr:hypothetical protein [Flavobacteriales bacterium]